MGAAEHGSRAAGGAESRELPGTALLAAKVGHLKAEVGLGPLATEEGPPSAQVTSTQ